MFLALSFFHPPKKHPFAFFPALLVSFPLLLFTLPILRNIFLTSPVMNPAPFLQSHITHPKVNASQDKKCVFPCLGSVPCSKVLAMRLNICFSTQVNDDPNSNICFQPFASALKIIKRLQPILTNYLGFMYVHF